MKNAKNIGLAKVAIVVLLSSSFAVVTQQEMAAAQMTIDQLGGAFCDIQEESEAQVGREQTADVTSGGVEDGVPTIDEFVADISVEREFDDQRIAEEQQANGIQDAKNILSARITGDDAKTALINQTFTKLLNNISESEEGAEAASPDIEEVEEEIDTDEVAQRQIISYEFNEEDMAVNDDIRIYTLPEATVQNLSSAIATFTNETDIDLYANGRMIITYAGESSFDQADDTRIYAAHNYTIVNGFRYANGTLYDRNGIEVFAASDATTIPRIPN
jgi:hypothetical protein